MKESSKIRPQGAALMNASSRDWPQVVTLMNVSNNCRGQGTVGVEWVGDMSCTSLFLI